MIGTSTMVPQFQFLLAEVIVVESDMSRGARLAIYDTVGLVSSTDFIGTPNRWLAPVGSGAPVKIRQA